MASTAPGARPSGESRGKVDYREVLSPEEFAAFVKLRTLRQTIAKDDAVPVYMIDRKQRLITAPCFRDPLEVFQQRRSSRIALRDLR